jgi:hypothetical protein
MKLIIEFFGFEHFPFVLIEPDTCAVVAFIVTIQLFYRDFSRRSWGNMVSNPLPHSFLLEKLDIRVR